MKKLGQPFFIPSGWFQYLVKFKYEKTCGTATFVALQFQYLVKFKYEKTKTSCPSFAAAFQYLVKFKYEKTKRSAANS